MLEEELHKMKRQLKEKVPSNRNAKDEDQGEKGNIQVKGTVNFGEFLEQQRKENQ